MLKRKGTSDSDQADGTKKARANGSIMSFVSTSAAKSHTSTAFDKEKWAASLTPETRDLLRLEIETLHESWFALLKDVIIKPDFLELKRFLNREVSSGRKVFPPREDIYSWSRFTPFDSVKVVILGQDPYHNDNQAHGLAFSVKPPTVAPPSLKNMYIALKKDYPHFTAPPNRGGLLTPWSERGVLLLNTCLTVRAHDANSHANHGWERFTQRVIDLVAEKRSKGVVFMAWGTPAGKRVQKIDTKKHLILRSVHPSPLSAHRGFFDCGHFRKANDWLTIRYGSGSEVDWSLGGPSEIADAKSVTPTGPVTPIGASTLQQHRNDSQSNASPLQPRNNAGNKQPIARESSETLEESIPSHANETKKIDSIEVSQLVDTPVKSDGDKSRADGHLCATDTLQDSGISPSKRSIVDPEEEKAILRALEEIGEDFEDDGGDDTEDELSYNEERATTNPRDDTKVDAQGPVQDKVSL